MDPEDVSEKLKIKLWEIYPWKETSNCLETVQGWLYNHFIKINSKQLRLDGNAVIAWVFIVCLLHRLINKERVKKKWEKEKVRDRVNALV